jgi:hypothetical protein
VAQDRSTGARLRFVREELTVVRITPSVIELIAAEARRSRDGDETGGALFGFDASTHGPPLISHALGPGPNAIR